MIALVLVLASGSVAGEADYSASSLQLSADERLALRDVDGDGDRDLIRVDASGIELRLLDADGRYADEPSGRLEWPDSHVAWDLVDFDGDGAVEVAMLVGGTDVRVFEATSEGAFADAGGSTVLEAKSYLPEGRNHMRFTRDVDGDGRADLVLPGSGRYEIRLQEEDGWSEPIGVAFEARISHRVGNPDRLDASFSQFVRIPWFRLEDVDGDGLRDLVASTDDRVHFHLADPGLSEAPTWTLDLASLRSELPEEDGINFDDLSTHIARQVDWRLEDLDGEGAKDLLLQVGGTFKLYRDGSRNGPDSTPDQLLKSSGNVVYFFLRDVTGDGLSELQIARVESLSLARVLRWLILPGKLDFDLFTYANRGGEFTRKPTRRNGLRIEIPRLLSLIDRAEELEERFESELAVAATRACLDPDGERNDVVDLVAGELRVYRDVVPEGFEPIPELESDEDAERMVERFVLEDLDRLEDGERKTIDLGDFERWDFSDGPRLREMCAKREAALSVPLALPTEAMRLRILDLNEDGREDVVAFGRTEVAEGAPADDARWVVQFLVSRPD